MNLLETVSKYFYKESDLKVDYLIGMYTEHAKQVANKLFSNLVMCTEFPSESLPNVVYGICEQDKITKILYNQKVYTEFSYHDIISTPVDKTFNWKFLIGKNYRSISEYVYKYHPDVEFTFIPEYYSRNDFYEKAVYVRYKNDDKTIYKIISSNI